MQAIDELLALTAVPIDKPRQVLTNQPIAEAMRKPPCHRPSRETISEPPVQEAFANLLGSPVSNHFPRLNADAVDGVFCLGGE
jgi:hypothetical protein